MGAFLEWLINLFRPRPRPPIDPPPVDPPGGGGLLYDELNRARARSGLRPFRLDAALDRAAKKHAAWMAASRTLSHQDAGGRWHSDRVRAEGYAFRECSENIGHGQHDAQEAVSDWLASAVGHRENVLGQWQDVGCGQAAAADGSRYWCAVFASR